jgi:L-ascorbate metabolism protein UlaG (beta-lactamase superfamily)
LGDQTYLASKETKTGKSKNWKIVLSAALLAVVVGAGYFAYQTMQSPHISVKYIGHSTFMIMASGKIIYTDPSIMSPPNIGDYKDKADIILVSHSHYDHLNMTAISKIRKDDTAIIAPADCVPIIGGNVKSLKPGEKLSIGSITVEAVEAYNFKRLRPNGNPYHPKGFGVGYLLTIGDKTIYHAGDTDFIPEMKDLKNRNIYLAMLPTGGTYTMDNPEAADSALAIQPRIVMSMHRWDTNPNEFKKAVEVQSSSIKVVLLQPGDVFEVG